MMSRELADLLFQRELLALQPANLLRHSLHLMPKLSLEVLNMLCDSLSATRLFNTREGHPRCTLKVVASFIASTNRRRSPLISAERPFVMIRTTTAMRAR
jgi:hypothetical protein